MPRLRNVETGVVVSVADATASRLASEWAPEGQAKTSPRRTSKKSKTDDE